MLTSSRLVIILAATLLLLSLCKPVVFRLFISAVFNQVTHFLASETCPGLDHCAAYLVFAAAAARILLLCVGFLQVARKCRIVGHSARVDFFDSLGFHYPSYG